MGDNRDAWAENQSGLSQFFREQPEVVRALDEADNMSLNGADLACKSALYKERGLLREAAELFRLAWRKCYPADYVREFESHLDFIAKELAGCPGRVVDIASGRGMLVERLLCGLNTKVTATDVSESVLEDHLGCRLSLIHI